MAASSLNKAAYDDMIDCWGKIGFARPITPS